MRWSPVILLLVSCAPEARLPSAESVRAVMSAPPIVSAERMVDAPVLQPREDVALRAEASDGTDHLVLFSDGGIRAVRIRSDGTVLDPLGILTAAGDDVVLGFDESRYVLLWTDAAPGGRELRLQRLASDGTLSAPQDLLLITAPSPRLGGVASSSDGTSLVVWDATPSVLYGARIDTSGAVLGSGPELLSASLLNPASVASDGTNFLVAWGAGANVGHSLWVGADGTLGPDRILGQAADFQRQLHVAYGDDRYLVIWIDRPSGQGALWGVRLDRSGHPLDPQPILIDGQHQSDVAATSWTGTDFLTVWRDVQEFGSPSPLFARRLSATATAAAPSFVIGAGYPVVQVVALSVDRTGMAFTAWRSYDFLEGTRVAGQSALDTPPLTIAWRPNNERAPQVASDGNGYLVVWSDERNQGVRGMLIGSDGVPTSTASIDFGPGLMSSLIFRDGEYLVSTGGTSAPRLTRIDPRGTMVGTSTAPMFGRLAYDPIDRATLIAWTRGVEITPGEFSFFVSATIIDAAGRVLGNQDLRPPEGSDTLGGVAFDGANFVLSWTHTGTTIRVARIAPDGTLLGPPTPISSAPGERSDPTLTRVGAALLAAWSDARGNRIYGTWIQDGAPVDPVGFPLTATSAGGATALAGDADRAILLWPKSSGALAASWITGTSTVIDPQGAAIDPRSHTELAVASAGGGRALVAYVNPFYDPNPPMRVAVRLVSLPSETPDAGIEDALDLDATAVDATTVDASVVDATTLDAEVADRGFFADAAQHDGAPAHDAASAPAPDAGLDTVAQADGCHCRAAVPHRDRADVATAPLILGLAGALLLRRRRSRLPLLLLISASFGCAPEAPRAGESGSALGISGEIDTDPPVPTGVHPGVSSAGVATDGKNFLVTWRDWRASTERIYASRVSGAGRLLDPLGTVLSTGASSFIGEDRTRAAFDGANYLVVWADTDPPPTGGWSSLIYGERISPLGQRVDPTKLVVHREPQFYDARWPDVACGAQRCLVIWDDGMWSLVGMRFDANMVALDTEPIRIGDASSQPSAVAFDGTNFQAVWEDWTNGTIVIRGARVRPSDGAVLESVAPTFSSSVGASRHGVSIACEGGEACLVSWGGADPGVARIEHGLATSRGAQATGALAFDGASYRTVWSSSVGVVAAALDATGNPGPHITLANEGWTEPPVLAATSTRVLAIWVGEPTPGRFSDVFGVRTGTAGEVLDRLPIPISSRANSQVAPVLAFDGTNYLAVWFDDRPIMAPPYFGGLFATRISTSGAVLDPVPLRIGPNSYSPRVAFDGTDFLAVWAGDCGFGCVVLDSARVSTDGRLLDPVPRRLFVKYGSCGSQYISHFGVAIDCGVGHCLALVGVFCESSSPPEVGGQIDALALDTSGPNVVTASTALYDSPATDLTVNFNGSEYLAVWAAGPDLLGARVSASGSVRDPNGVPLVSSTTVTQSHPRLTHDGQQWTLVFERNQRIWRTRVSSAAVSLDMSGLPVTGTIVGQQQSPSIASEGLWSLVVWNDGRRDPAASDLYGAWIDDHGTVITPSGFSVAAGVAPEMVSGAAGQMLLAYQRFEASSPFDATRVHGRSITLDGMSCDDGQRCTAPDVYSNHQCVGSPVVCTPGICEVTVAGCDPQTGRCSYGPAADGTPCAGGTCGGGICLSAPDAGTTSDAEIDAGLDGGTAEAGVPDAATQADAMMMTLPDAASSPDRALFTDGPASDGASGLDAGGSPPTTSGCGCRASSAGDGSLDAVLLLGLFPLLRPRRRSDRVRR